MRLKDTTFTAQVAEYWGVKSITVMKSIVKNFNSNVKVTYYAYEDGNEHRTAHSIRARLLKRELGLPF